MQRIAEVELPSELVDRARAGDSGAHELIYRAYARSVYSLARRLLTQGAAADDVVQEVFLEILRSVGRYEAKGPFGAWVRSIAVSKCLMHLRSPWRRLRLGFMDDGASNESQLVSADVGPERRATAERDLERALAQLPGVTRAVVWLHDVEGLTHGEIARLFGRTSGFSKSQLARAHERLRYLLREEVETKPCTSLSTIC